MRLLSIRTLFLVLIGFGLAYGLRAAATASDTVPASHAGVNRQPVTPDALKPAACAAITVSHLSVGAGVVPGTPANDLILGSAGNDTLGSNSPGQGSDCCVGGGGVDVFNKSCAVSVP
jgi:hypothetical protein